MKVACNPVGVITPFLRQSFGTAAASVGNVYLAYSDGQRTNQLGSGSPIRTAAGGELAAPAMVRYARGPRGVGRSRWCGDAAGDGGFEKAAWRTRAGLHRPSESWIAGRRGGCGCGMGQGVVRAVGFAVRGW